MGALWSTLTAPYRAYRVAVELRRIKITSPPERRPVNEELAKKIFQELKSESVSRKRIGKLQLKEHDTNWYKEQRASLATFDNPSKNGYKSAADIHLEVLHRFAEEKLGIDMIQKINICVVGQRGVGKSSLINGLRGLKNGAVGAAKVDVNEDPGDIKQYPIAASEHIILWDCPGTGTLRRPKLTYFFDMCLYAFDHLLVVFIDNLGESEIDLIKQAIAYQVPFAIIRNKANNDLVNMPHDNPRYSSMPVEQIKKELIQQHRAKIKDTLEKAKIDQSSQAKIFIINAKAFAYENMETFEEDELVDHMVTDIVETRGYDKVRVVGDEPPDSGLVTDDEPGCSNSNLGCD